METTRRPAIARAAADPFAGAPGRRGEERGLRRDFAPAALIPAPRAH
jgi:hypothetical protein